MLAIANIFYLVRPLKNIFSLQPAWQENLFKETLEQRREQKIEEETSGGLLTLSTQA